MASSPVIYSTPLEQDHRPEHDAHTMGRVAPPSSSPRDKPHIDIILDNPVLTLKGTGPDIETARLSGNVVLYLTEATDLKEVTLQFRGKARIPIPAAESVINNPTLLTYVVCNHNWSFLEGARHTRTLKSGRHFFPFHLQVGGSLPSSLSTPVLGGASIAYKLRAVAVRPLLSQNLQTMVSVPLMRSVFPEGLEYQQSLEIENTWPDKIMYSVTLPHKAWAIGDKLAALVKFSPLAKGITVESILTNVVETTRVFARSGRQEDSRVVASSRHDFIAGRSVLIEANKPWLIIGQSSPHIGSRTPRETTSLSSSPPPSTSALPSSWSTHPSTSSSATSSNHPTSPHSDTVSGDIVSALFLPLPEREDDIVPSHFLEPITVSHRVRWSIYIRNPDFHLSELRCTLPILILNSQLLNEVRGYTRMTRRLVLAPGLPGASTDEELEFIEDMEALDDIEDRELPSYLAHVRDRVANMYLPEAATMRVTNPWLIHGTSPTSPNTFMESTTGAFALGEDGPAPPLVNTQDAMSILSNTYLDGQAGSGVLTGLSSMTSLFSSSSRPSIFDSQTPPRPLSSPHYRHATSHPDSGCATPLHAASHVISHLPHAPGSGESTPLDWINSELMMSLSDNPRLRFGASVGHADGVQSSSHTASTTHSRATSADCGRPLSRPLTPVEGEGHAHGRGLGGFFKGAMKGFAFTKHHGHSPPGSTIHTTEHSSRPSLWSHPVTSTASPRSAMLSLNPEPSSSCLPSSVPRSRPTSRASSPFRSHQRNVSGSHHETGGPGTPVTGTSPLPAGSSTNNAMSHLAFTEVPDYSIASKGFIGGVPPLSSMHGLPSYEESARSEKRKDSTRAVSPLACASRQDIDDGVGIEKHRQICRSGTLASDGDVTLGMATMMNHAGEEVAFHSQPMNGSGGGDK